MLPCRNALEVHSNYYPEVIINQYPEGIYLPVIAGDHPLMDKYGIRRENLRALISIKFGGNQTAFGSAIDRPANYISRCLSMSDNPKSRKNRVTGITG